MEDVHDISGWLDGMRDNVVTGWAKNEADLSAVEIDIYIDDILVERVLANKEREDLSVSGLGDCAFEYRIPDLYHDGSPHSVIVKISATGKELGICDFRFFKEKFKTKTFVSKPITSNSEVFVSVVIPTYNRSSTLELTLSNIAKEAINKPVEIIVIDDGSTDSTIDAIMRQQKIFKSIRFEKIANKGPGNARNIGASLSRGEILIFMGDDTRIARGQFFEAHYKAHQSNKNLYDAVLGKIVWPDNPLFQVNNVMSLIQGDGQQQFGYKYLRPWQKYSHWVFYTANVSIKRDIVSDWLEEGFSPDFSLAAFEDAEFAYRMTKKYPDFGIYYTAGAVVEHYHPYNVEGFIKRQTSCGLMLDVIIRKHPELSLNLLGESLHNILHNENTHNYTNFPLNHYLNAIEGLKSWAIIIDNHYRIGSQNWHASFLNAIFKLSMLDAYLMLQNVSPQAQASSYRYLLETFRSDMHKAIETEVLGSMPGFGFI
jgi:glycosyltransferase involved in cell wall biosynthesis